MCVHSVGSVVGEDGQLVQEKIFDRISVCCIREYCSHSCMMSCVIKWVG